jgi:hypothetical protein
MAKMTAKEKEDYCAQRAAEMRLSAAVQPSRQLRHERRQIARGLMALAIAHRHLG